MTRRTVLPAPRPTSALARGDRTGEMRIMADGITVTRWDGTDWQPVTGVGLPAGLGRGILAGGTTRRTTNLLNQSTEVAVLNSAAGYTINAARSYRIIAGGLLGVSIAAAAPQLALRVVSGTATVTGSSSVLDIDRHGPLDLTGLGGASRYNITRELMPGDLASGTWSFGLTAVLISGTGLWSCYADPIYPTFLTIEDKGIPGAVSVP